jgi:phosphate starvation-inducible PhoH-like protein
VSRSRKSKQRKARKRRLENLNHESPRKIRNENGASGSLLHPLEPKTDGQARFLAAIKSKPVVVCDGPAGTGKTFISFGCALQAVVHNSNITRIVIVRPTITAGDEPSLGFLPGTLDDKMAPFLAPILRDSAPLLIKRRKRTPADERFIERFGNERSETAAILSKFDIEIVPLHLMRGRTFHNAFVILDEAQNCSLADFKLFLTRIGKRSQVVIEGDATQKDRTDGALPELVRRLDGLDSVGIIQLTGADIIRNPIISDLIKRLDS